MDLDYQLGHGHENSTEFRFTCVFGTRVQRNPPTKFELMMACAVPKSGTSSTAQLATPDKLLMEMEEARTHKNSKKRIPGDQTKFLEMDTITIIEPLITE